jgi:hypothetical protein
VPRLFLLSCGLLAAAGCASYSETHLGLRDQFVHQDLAGAQQLVDDLADGRNQLLAFLETATIHHAAGRWQESNQVFQQAEDLAEDLYTRSVSEGAFSLISNDTTISYRADPHELAMIPYYRAFNYLNLGDVEAAQVEARKASLILARSVETMFQSGGDAAVAVEDLERNAFLHYFAGLIYEHGGAFNDAFTAYRNAAMAYAADGGRMGVGLPPWLGGDLRRVGAPLGFTTEVEQLESRVEGLDVPRGDPGGPTPDRGTVAVFVENGWVAHKEQRTLNLPILTTDSFGDSDAWASAIALRAGPAWVMPYGVSVRYWLTMALPTMVGPDPSGPTGAEVQANPGGVRSASVPVESVSTRARMVFDEKYPRILTKTIARALVKWAASEAARNEDEVAGALVNLFGIISERADTRSWLTLPDSIALVRMDLAPGTYDLRIDYRDRRGGVIASETLTGVRVEAGRWSFFSRRVF